MRFYTLGLVMFPLSSRGTIVHLTPLWSSLISWPHTPSTTPAIETTNRVFPLYSKAAGEAHGATLTPDTTAPALSTPFHWHLKQQEKNNLPFTSGSYPLSLYSS